MIASLDEHRILGSRERTSATAISSWPLTWLVTVRHVPIVSCNVWITCWTTSYFLIRVYSEPFGCATWGMLRCTAPRPWHRKALKKSFSDPSPTSGRVRVQLQVALSLAPNRVESGPRGQVQNSHRTTSLIWPHRPRSVGAVWIQGWILAGAGFECSICFTQNGW
jgi:hypothetical protein